jgi:hypothetical protein
MRRALKLAVPNLKTSASPRRASESGSLPVVESPLRLRLPRRKFQGETPRPSDHTAIERAQLTHQRVLVNGTRRLARARVNFSAIGQRFHILGLSARSNLSPDQPRIGLRQRREVIGKRKGLDRLRVVEPLAFDLQRHGITCRGIPCRAGVTHVSQPTLKNRRKHLVRHGCIRLHVRL